MDVNDFLPLTFLFQITKIVKPIIIVNTTPRTTPAMIPPILVPDDDDDDDVDGRLVGPMNAILLGLVNSASNDVVLLSFSHDQKYSLH